MTLKLGEGEAALAEYALLLAMPELRRSSRLQAVVVRKRDEAARGVTRAASLVALHRDVASGRVAV